MEYLGRLLNLAKKNPKIVQRQVSSSESRSLCVIRSANGTSCVIFLALQEIASILTMLRAEPME